MGDEDKKDVRLDYIKDRIGSAFPKLVGVKLDKLLAADEVREALTLFCDDDHARCLVVPDTMRMDNVIPVKMSAKAKVLVRCIIIYNK